MQPIRCARALALLAPTILVCVAASSLDADGPPGSGRDRNPLRRWEGPARPERPAPDLVEPFAIRPRSAKSAPTTGSVRPHAEYEPMAGVLFRYDRNEWAAVVSQMVAELTADPAHDEKAWVLVSGNSQRNRAQSDFESAGADLSKVVFLTLPTDSIWIRDYGPQFVWLDDTLAVVDNRYFTARPADNFVPRLLAEGVLVAPNYEIGLYHFGGNFLASADRQGFVTSLVNDANPAFGSARVAELFGLFHGVETLHVFPTLPSTVDATGHIDMWLQLASASAVVISEFLPGSDPSAIAITEQAAQYMQQVLGYDVFRTPALDGPHPLASNTHFTYTNVFRVNDRIFVPVYGRGGAAHAARDAQALAAWQLAAPDAQIVPIDAWDLVYAAGVLHCIVMQVPRYASPTPAASVIAPSGGEVLVPGRVQTIEWSATDDEAVESIDLMYSTDDGVTFAPIASDLPHTGRHDWVVPAELGDRARVKVVARDGEARTGEATSAASFSISDAMTHTYDFSTGAGVSRRAWGHEVAAWGGLGPYRRPPNLTVELTPDEYAALSASDATGGDTDSNRLRSPIPRANFTTAHVFELTIDESPATMRQLDIIWEGYGDSCLQVELYVWDQGAGTWCDGAGGCGQKRYVDAASGNRDVTMRGSIRQDFDHYLDAQGHLTLLLVAAGPNQETFHDYLAVTVTYVADADGDHVPDAQDCAPTDPGAWAVPGEVPSLHASIEAGQTLLEWTAPTDPGGLDVTYDVLGAADPASFDLGECVAGATSTLSATDLDALAPDELRGYLARAANGCGWGTLGSGSGGAPRPAPPACP